MASHFDFRDSIALVTGAARGLGNAAARQFAKGGARVVINDLDASAAGEAASRLGEGHIGVAADVSSEKDVNAMVEQVIDRFGKIDILVNNAGIPDSFTPTVDQTLDHWQRLIGVHLTGTFLVSKTVAKRMIEAGNGGAIVNLNSIGGVVGLPVRTAYSTAKAGIGMMTRVLGCEWGQHGIRVNAVAPGYILTPMLEGLIEAGKIDATQIRRRTPMGALGTAQHIADAIAFLASDKAAFINGVTLPVDGGYMAFGAPGDAFPVDE